MMSYSGLLEKCSWLFVTAVTSFNMQISLKHNDVTNGVLHCYNDITTGQAT